MQPVIKTDTFLQARAPALRKWLCGQDRATSKDVSASGAALTFRNLSHNGAFTPIPVSSRRFHVVVGLQICTQPAFKAPACHSSRPKRVRRGLDDLEVGHVHQSKRPARTLLLRDAASVRLRSLSLCCDVSSQTMHWSALACVVLTVQHKLAHQ